MHVYEVTPGIYKIFSYIAYLKTYRHGYFSKQQNESGYFCGMTLLMKYFGWFVHMWNCCRKLGWYGRCLVQFGCLASLILSFYARHYNNWEMKNKLTGPVFLGNWSQHPNRYPKLIFQDSPKSSFRHFSTGTI